MKKLLATLLTSVLAATLALSAAACSSNKNGTTQIFIPNDGSNCTRALFVLQQEGLIKLKDGVKASDSLSDLDIADKNGYDIKLVEASTIPAQLKEAPEGTLAVINGNYAITNNLALKTALATESATGEAAQLYANIIAVRQGDENNAGVAVLNAVLQSQATYDYIVSTFDGAVLPSFTPKAITFTETTENLGTVTVGASPAPHAQILEHVKDEVAKYGYTLNVVSFDDYVLPNTSLEDGDLTANYFQHEPYLTDFNATRGTHIVVSSKIHYEPMGLFGNGVSADAYKALPRVK